MTEALKLPGTSAFQGTLTAGCNALIDLGTTYFQSWLASLDATADGMTLSTEDGNPCTLYEKSNKHIIEAFGKQEPVEDRCKWKVKMMLGSVEAVIDAQFWGTRVQ